ncbi:MAG: GNVR domain-containing protein [Woeseiaceae bacterium]|nr:GNVR domain-containing protein [Woeseiaceae bacterium]
MQELIRQIVAQLKGSWRFRWTAMVIAWLICLFGWLAVYALPDTYESEATLYVDTSSTLRPLLEQMTIGNDVLSRVEMVRTAMTGRPLLLRVARDTDLHLRAGTPEQMDNLIEGMRERISILNDPRRDPSLYNIRYRDESPVAAQAVVGSMLNMFIEDSLGESRVDTEKAQAFLRQELQKLEQDLQRAETELAEFKKQNVGKMPGESGTYFERLQSSMDELEATQSTLRLARRKHDALIQQLAGEQPLLDSSTGQQSELDQRISDNQSRLEELQLRFTDLHPDVIAVKESLEQLRAQKQAQLDELAAGDGTGIASDNPVFQNIQIELTTVNVQIETLLEQEATQQRRIAELRELIDVLPQVEAQLARLTRDYDVHQVQYQDLLQRLEIAELSESAEQSDEVQFRIIDPPRLPDDAVAPNRPLLLLVVLVGGLAAGAGLAFLGNQLKPVFHDVMSLRDVTGMPVLGSVTGLRTQGRNAGRSRQVTAFSFALLMLCAAFVGVFLFHETGGALVRSYL